MLVFAVACTGEQADQGATAVPADDKPDIIATNAFYYYDDVEAAWTFYRDTLGLETVVDYGFAKILRLAESSYLTVVLAEEGMHSADEPKNVTLHLVTDELNRWHGYLLRLGREIEYDDGGDAVLPGNSFVILDAEGYRIRFVRHNPHPNHDSYVESFAAADPVMSTAGDKGDMSIRATAFSVYYNNAADVGPFFEGLFAVEPAGLLDGSPIYQLSGSGFVSLEDYAGGELSSPGENGMTLSFFTSDVDAWFARASTWPGFELRTPEVIGESGLVNVFVGYDPSGVFLEWDTFLDLPENQALLDHLKLSDAY
jgi:catechol 2,3-dioxygenase-like lactoylglutathione lyase family enzyme